MVPYIEDHRNTLDPDNVRDFLDMMLVECQQVNDEGSCWSSKIGYTTIINSMIDLFIAGMETTSRWDKFQFVNPWVKISRVKKKSSLGGPT